MPTVLSRRPGGGGGGAPSGPAGGSLSGTYPNPGIADGSVTVAKMDSEAEAAGLVATSDGAGGVTWEAPGGEKLFDSTLGDDAATIDTGAAGIDTSYDVLEFFIIGRTTEAVVQSTALLRFNNDSGANYDVIRNTVTNTTVAGTISLAATSVTIVMLGANAQTGAAGTWTGRLPGYAATVFHKSGDIVNTTVEDTAADTRNGLNSFRWRSTAAISRMAITAGSGNLLAGSRLLIYGR